MTRIVNPETKIYANAFNLIGELGPISLNRIQGFFGDFKLAWGALGADFLQAGLDEKKIQAIIAKRPQIKPEQSWEQLQKHKIEVLLLDEKEYPEILSEIPSPPPIIYTRGDQQVLKKNSIAVVGTRKMTSYGKRVTEDIVGQLINAGLNVVSGLAFGVDAAALQTAIISGSPVAVLASSLDNNSISPKANYLLAQKIIQQGCLISEYPLGASVQKQNFPIRNRIMAALTLGTLVIEADEESGSLITAKYALDFNREVFAIPGSIFSEVSRGTNRLIQQGAKLVASAADIIQELNLDMTISLPEEVFETSEDERLVLENLNHEPLHIDDLIRKIALNAGQINATLTMLEMKGRIKNMGGGSYIKTR